MTKEHCIAVTTKGSQCKNVSVDGLFCRVHSGVDRSTSTEEDPVTVETSQSFDAIIDVCNKLIFTLESVVDIAPAVVDSFLKKSGLEMIAPNIMNTVKGFAATTAKMQLSSVKKQVANFSTDPSKHAQLLELTKVVEKIALEAVKKGDKLIPDAIKAELMKLIIQLQALRN